MYTLANNHLSVDILDPLEDQHRFGTRYCTGGYIFQITDALQGPLLSGPTYPESFNTFDGQGIPDSFNHIPLRHPAKIDPHALILGIGTCDLIENAITELCTWQIEASTTSACFTTKHTFGPYCIELTRKVSLHNRSVTSHTEVCNQSAIFVPINWFPHPFFPQPTEPELCSCNLTIKPFEHEAYHMGRNGFIMRSLPPRTPGYFMALQHSFDSPLNIVQRHDTIGLIATQCDYIPAGFPIWGNEKTFSWEPYVERTIFPGEKTSWNITYHF